MTSAFDKALAHTLGLEGGYSNHEDDSGGVTNYGITEQVARAFGYSGPMVALPLKVAVDIYRQNYWDLLRLDQVAMLSEEVAIEMFDTAVNCSPGFAGRSFQRCLNVLNRGAKDFADIEVDGLIGKVSVSSLATFLAKRGKNAGPVLLTMLNSLQGAYYVGLAEKREKDEAFIFGWFMNRVKI